MSGGVSFLPYGRQWIDDDDVMAVGEVLRSDYLTTGPKVAEFESTVAGYCGVGHGVAVASGTAALHTAMFALGVGPGDEVIVPAISFAATANCALYMGATPVFADVDPDTLLIDPDEIERRVNRRTKAVIAVDYAGHPCRYATLRAIAHEKNIALVADGCHALGAEYMEKPVGSLADLTVFSFHPVKHVAAGEGGMIVAADVDIARRSRLFRNHGIDADHREREAKGQWEYDMVELGFNYRLTDMQCALGISQMRKLPMFLSRRRELAARYDAAFADSDHVRPLLVGEDVKHAYHLYVVRTPASKRAEAFKAMRAAGIGVNVHYLPIYLHSYYRRRLGMEPGLCPNAEQVYGEILSLPMFPAMTDADVDRVVVELKKAVGDAA